MHCLGLLSDLESVGHFSGLFYFPQYFFIIPFIFRDFSTFSFHVSFIFEDLFIFFFFFRFFFIFSSHFKYYFYLIFHFSFFIQIINFLIFFCFYIFLDNYSLHIQNFPFHHLSKYPLPSLWKTLLGTF